MPANLSRLLVAFIAAAMTVHGAVTSPTVIPVGGLCSGIAGPVQDTCVKGSTCCFVSPDQSVCAVVEGEKCPDHFIPEGGFCAGFAGPLPFPCVPGTTCCYLFPDQAVCTALPPNRACPKIQGKAA
ncbi:hypothetical protein DFP72DRAFT_927858 [Ephemerocybe angulata]|uniref:Uncharacterized protein n=1 Tax=Ephemerocybe angulata TaxID=980116 RepID=A0A8H6HD45_9AGAR|nr:hypothetical protein DFP72DRAFT_927657 [Tulosesus angulatus]KAF6744737.1 hypothetical protein DFP72DRAFT_927858 [Tulosesus angulatus]